MRDGEEGAATWIGPRGGNNCVREGRTWSRSFLGTISFLQENNFTFVASSFLLGNNCVVRITEGEGIGSRRDQTWGRRSRAREAAMNHGDEYSRIEFVPNPAGGSAILGVADIPPGLSSCLTPCRGMMKLLLQRFLILPCCQLWSHVGPFDKHLCNLGITSLNHL
jgi:hypothetical protein